MIDNCFCEILKGHIQFAYDIVSVIGNCILLILFGEFEIV